MLHLILSDWKRIYFDSIEDDSIRHLYTWVIIDYATSQSREGGERKMKQISKKMVVIILVLLMTVSSVSSLTQVLKVPSVHGQNLADWPGKDINGDGNVDILDTIQYVKLHYASYNHATGSYSWSFTDPYDSSMADLFMQSILNIEYIRNANHDKNVFDVISKLLTMYADGLSVDNYDGTPSVIKDDKSFLKFAIKNFLTDANNLKKALDPIFSVVGPVSKVVELLRSSGLKDIEIGQFESTVITYLVDEGGIWLTKIDTEVTWVNLRFDSASADTFKYPKLAGLSNIFRVAMAIYDFANVIAKHILNIIQIGKSAAMESVKQYEIYQVEMIRLFIEIVGKIAQTVGEGVIQPAYAQALITVCAGLAIGGGPAGIVAALVVAAAGIVLYYTISNIVDKAITFAADETLGLDLAIYKKLSASPNEVYIPLYEIKVLGISDQDEDNYIPWGSGSTGEDVYVVVKNIGVRTINLRVDPTIDTFDPATGKTGWSIINKDPLAIYNWIEKANFNPGDSSYTDFVFHVNSGTIEHNWPWPFSSINDKWIPGENPAGISFAFNHDVRPEWWDIFDRGNKYITTSFAVFYNSVDILITVHGGLDITNGKTLTRQIDVKNLKTTTISYTPEVHLIDPFGPMNKYDSQITILPNGPITVQPQEVSSFNIQWTAPSDAPIGYYNIAVNAKDQSGKRYTDNLVQQTIFYLYKLNVVFPTSANPAEAGDPNSPNQIYVYVKGLPPQQTRPTFFVTIGSGGGVAQNEIIDELPIPVGLTLKVTPPGPPVIVSEGKYDLQVYAFWGEGIQLYSSDMEPNAVEYTSAPSIEPIEKGLAWLRTQRYGDGSWLGNVGVTGLCTLAFLNAGYDETDATVNKAINYILSKVHSDGSIYTSYSVYETSIAILPLVATHNEGYALIIENAKNWLVGAQQDENFGYTPINPQYGGWTYWSAKGDPDLSNTQFALLALDAANLPKTDPTWSKAITFTQRCQNRPASNDQAWAHVTTQPSYNDGGFIYRPWGWSLAGGTLSYGSMTGAGIWGLLLSGVPKTDERVVAALDWVTNHYTWDNNPVYGSRPYYYYLSMSKALTMYGEPVINGHDWYQELYDKIVGMQIDAGSGKGYWSTPAEDYNPYLTTAYAILSLQTRAAAPPVQRLSYLTFILRSNCLIRVIDPDGNLVGYNYMTGLGENNIPTALYSGPYSELQYIVIVNPKPGTYKLELVGIAEGPYTLTIQGNYGEEVTKRFEYTGEINPGELDGSPVTVTAIVGPIDIYTSPPQFEEVIIDRSSLSYTGATSGQYSDTVALSATLKDLVTNSPISGKTVSFTIGTQTATGTTDASGVATASITLTQPSGAYTVTAFFAGDSNYLSSSDSKPFTIDKENVAITYTGDTLVFTAGPTISTAPVHLAAHVVQESDGSPGDLTLAIVTFELFKSSNLGSTPDLTYDASVDSAGDAHYDVASLVADVWTVKVTIKSGNLYWTQTSEGLGILTVSLPGLSATGGGWVPDFGSANGRDNFGFTVQYNKNQAPKGNFVFVFRGKDGYDYVVKSNSWQGGGLSFMGTNKAYFSGKCNVQKIDRTTGAVVASWGNYRFAVDITDGDLITPHTADTIAIRILNSINAIWQQIGTSTAQIPLGGGNIVIHSK